MSDLKTGINVLTATGFLWWAIGTYSIPFPWKYGALGIGFVLSGLILTRTLFMAARRHKLDRRVFLWSLLFEASAIFGCVWLLNKPGFAGYIFPAVAVVVGLHFIGIWKASERADCLWLAGLLCVLGIAATALPLPLRNQALGFTVAAALWTCAALRTNSPQNGH